MNIGQLCALYIAEFPKLGESQRYRLERLQREPIAKAKAPGTARDFILHCRKRRAVAAPATVMHDIVSLRGVLSYAKPGWGYQTITHAPIIEAMPVLRKEGLIGTSKRRTRIPSADEKAQIMAYFTARGDSVMADIVDFQEDSTRRISETLRLIRGDLDEATMTILVRDMKHPRHKEGNHKRVALPVKSFEILIRQPRRSADPLERFFPFQISTIKAKYHGAIKALGYDGLTLHDSRRGGTTRLLKEGRSVHEVMLVTGHDGPSMVLTDYNGLRAEDFHKMRAPA